MIYSMGLYYKFCLLEPLGHELHTKMNIIALETTFFLFVYSKILSFVLSFQHTNNKNTQDFFEWCSILVYIIIILLSNLYDVDGIRRLIQKYKYSILAYLGFISFVVSFKLIKSLKCTKILWMMSSMGLYYNYRVLEPLWYELRKN
jgi:hypothetical protein